uniref:Guanylate cyclase activator 2B n=1 Tax=Xenopus tropicalis TaxID=8364 RepID=A0A803JT09_XENTR
LGPRVPLSRLIPLPQVGKFTFHVKSVLELKKVIETEEKEPTEVTQELCHSNALPEEFHPVCEEDNAPDIFIQLGIVPCITQPAALCLYMGGTEPLSDC